MKKIDNWETTSASGEFEKLELGGHVCKIMKAEAKQTSTKKDALVLFLDIARGAQTGYYAKQYKEDARDNKRWGCQFLQITEGKSVPFFKGMITAIEKSNPGYVWNWDEKTLAGKLVGGVFGREQYEANDGTLKFATKCMQIRSIDGVEDVDVPDDKPLKTTGYSNPFQATGALGSGFTDLSDDDSELPF